MPTVFSEGFEDRLYEAGAIPECWPLVLHEFMGAIDGGGSVLVVKRGDDLRWVASSDEFAEVVRDHYAHPQGQDRTARLLKANHAGFLSEHQLWSDDELMHSSLYQELLIPRGYGRSVATAVFSPGGESFIFHAEGPSRLGKVSSETIEALDRMRPHLARAALLSSRLGLERTRALTRALDLLEMPAIILSERGRITSITKSAEELIPTLVQDRNDRLYFNRQRIDKLFWGSFVESIRGNRYDQVLSFPVRDDDSAYRAIAHLVPLKGAANDVFSSGSAVLLFAEIGIREIANIELIEGLFDLTPSEARVAKAIGEGLSVEQIARQQLVSQATTRVHVKRILSKLGVSRQSEIVGLLQGATLGRTLNRP